MHRHNMMMWLVIIVGAAIVVGSLAMAYFATGHYREQVLKQSSSLSIEQPVRPATG